MHDVIHEGCGGVALKFIRDEDILCPPGDMSGYVPMFQHFTHPDGTACIVNESVMCHACGETNVRLSVRQGKLIAFTQLPVDA